ncbi:HNH endonuclease [Klosneuvirus KNV1]|uniref:HNH endonuclease n=1 Tax=Klosneuvirus KNV1 TaxID=1977640 RepID=A0A1V0SIP3_9VIRU|nr:HNH endonuclease [Klosneuvirus KNV1]
MELKLNNGTIVLISPDDYELVNKCTWHKNKGGYAQGDMDNKTILMHRLIMNFPKGKIVDHINRNKLDNRKENLRVVDRFINSRNRNVSKSKIHSKYRGVFYHKKNNKYAARIIYNNKRMFIGNFNNEYDAATSFDMYIIHNKIDEIELNFPEKRNDYINTQYISTNKQCSSKYIGVCFEKKKNKYFAKILHNKKQTCIKYSENEMDCAKAYDKYIVTNNIPSKRLNFPDDYPEYNKNYVIKTSFELINETTIKLILSYNKNNDEILIDKDDYDKIKCYTWSINKGYVCAKQENKQIRLHRFIMNANDPETFIDHIDSNPFNNKKNNLRISNPQKNGQNKVKCDNASSQYYNVLYNKRSNKWIIKIGSIYVGRERLEILAARRRDLYIMDHLPDSHYKMNFEWTPEDIEMWKLALRI